MINKQKNNLLWFSLPVIALVLVVVVYFVSPKQTGFKLDAAQSVRILGEKAVQGNVFDWSGKLLVDIRSADQFANAHIANAISIPVRQLLDEASIESFKGAVSKGMEIVLYSDDALQTAAPVLLLRQMGFEHVSQAIGSHNASGAYVLSSLPDPEKPEWDPAQMKASPVQQQEASPQAVKKPEVVVPARKAASPGGGC